MERDLLSRVTGDSGRQRLQGRDQDPRPPPSPTLSLRIEADTIHGHGREAQQAANVVSQLPSSSRVQCAPDGRRLASVVVPGYPMSERRHNLRAAGDGGARSQATASGMPVQEQRASPAAPGPAPQLPPMAPPGSRTLELAVAGPTVTTGPGPGQERCDACGISARLLQGLAGDLDRARAQVALLTCQNESLRHRLKRASASVEEEAGPECPVAASAPAPHLNLRCGACGVRPATVLLVPREHLCLCGHCVKSSRNGAAFACPVCRGGVGTWLAELAVAAPR